MECVSRDIDRGIESILVSRGFVMGPRQKTCLSCKRTLSRVLILQGATECPKCQRKRRVGQGHRVRARLDRQGILLILPPS